MKRHLFWIIYTAWVAAVLFTHTQNHFWAFDTPLLGGKGLIWLVFLSFSAYTIYCSMTEDFFKSLRKILVFKWGRQIGTDLTIGLLLFAFIVFLHSGSALTTCLWLIPFICFGNLASLLYFAVHFESLTTLFLQ
jgi:hypothetical protein